MKIALDRHRVGGDLARRIEGISGQKLFACYQCGNCTAGCPVAFAMEVGPHQAIRYILLGMDEATAVNTPWVCAACQQCTSRCPKGIDIARVMEALRLVVLRTRERPDRISIVDLPDGMLERVPQMGLVGAFRKMTS
jgi:heterodisulfide reductase subunit C